MPYHGDDADARTAAHYAAWVSTLEVKLSEAVDSAISSMATDPVCHVAEQLLKGQLYAAQHAETIAALVKAATTLEATPAAPQLQGLQAWSATRWLASSAGDAIASAITSALLRPLHATMGDHPAPAHTQAYLRQLGSQATPKRVHLIESMLRESNLLHEVAVAVCGAAETLEAKMSASESIGSAARALSDKFAANTFELSFGQLEAFFSGLEGLVGSPSPMLFDAMSHEHCNAIDSTMTFTTPNYGYHFHPSPGVTAPSPTGLC